MPALEIQHFGITDYEEMMLRMDDLFEKRKQGEIPNTLLVLEHHPVITRGRKMTDVELPQQAQILEQGIQIVNADRGGELTFHGPGQIVVYFILELKDYFLGIREMVSGLETALLKFLQQEKIEANTDPNHPGIWVGGQKVASLGLRVSRGFTKHGIALNVKNDLSIYDWFSPCGLSGSTMTTMEKLLQKEISEHEFLVYKEKLLACFCKEFQNSERQEKT